MILEKENVEDLNNSIGIILRSRLLEYKFKLRERERERERERDNSDLFPEIINSPLITGC